VLGSDGAHRVGRDKTAVGEQAFQLELQPDGDLVADHRGKLRDQRGGQRRLELRLGLQFRGIGSQVWCAFHVVGARRGVAGKNERRGRGQPDLTGPD
jgi:hypothetical protein